MAIKYGVLNERLINVINSRSKMDGDGQVIVPKEPIPTKSVLIKTDKPRPYICMICTRAFARAEHLKRHERAHTKEKPFSCSSCGRNFSRKDLLLRHKQKLHAIIPIPEKTPKATTGPTKVGKKTVAPSPPEKKREGTPYSNYSLPDSVSHSRQVSVDSSIDYLNEPRFSSFAPRGQFRVPEVDNIQNSYADQFSNNADFASLTPAYYGSDTFEANDQLMTDSNGYETPQHGIAEQEHMSDASYARLWDIYHDPLADGSSRISDTHSFPQAQHYPQPAQGKPQGPDMHTPLNTPIKQEICIQPKSIELQTAHTYMNPVNATNTDAENAKSIKPSLLRNVQEFPTVGRRTNGEFQSETRKARSQTRSARSSSFNASSATTYLKKKDVSIATPETAPVDAEQHAVEFSTPQLLAIDESPFQIEDIDAICLEPGIDHVYQDQFGNFTDPNNQFQVEIDLYKFNLSSMNSPHSSGSVYPLKDPHMFLNNLYFEYNPISPIEGTNSGLHTNLLHSNDHKIHDHKIHDHDQHHAHNSAANEPPKC